MIRSGQWLELSVQWPRAMTDMAYLHQKWLSTDPMFNRGSFRLLSFHSFLRRFHRSTDEPIVSSFRLKLPIKVKTEVSVSRENVWYLKWPSLGQEIILYVTLEAPDANYIADEEEEPAFHSV